MDEILALLREIVSKKFTAPISIGTATAVTTFLTVKFLLEAIKSYPLLNQIAAVAGLSFLIALGILGIWHYFCFVLYSRRKWDVITKTLRETGAYPRLPPENGLILASFGERTYGNTPSKSRVGMLFLIALIVAATIAGTLIYQHQIPFPLPVHAHNPSVGEVNPYPSYLHKFAPGTSAIDDPLSQSSKSSWQTVPNWCRFVGQAYLVSTFAGKVLMLVMARRNDLRTLPMRLR